MRLAKPSGTVIALLALLGWATASLPAQTKAPAKAAPQTGQPAKTAKAKSPPAKPAAAQPAKPAGAPPAKAAPAQGAKQPAKAPAKAKKAPATKAAAAPAAPPNATVARRDPFDPLVGRQRPGGEIPEHLPPGKAGLVVNTLRLDGLVRGPNGMIAVVSNPQQRVYFLREGDRLYDGRVEHITLEAVLFHEIGKDPFGKPVDRQVTKRLYPSPGEQR